MGKVQEQIFVQVNKLSQVLSELQNQLESPSLSDEDRAIQSKILVIMGILDFLLLTRDNASEKKRKLLSLCLEGGKCTTHDAAALKFDSVDSLRFARNQMVALLSKTVLCNEKLDVLMKGTTMEEVDQIKKWFLVNVYTNKKLISSLSD